MAKIIFKNTTSSMLKNIPPVIEPNRDYLGMSGLGDPCLRRQFYTWRWASKKIVNAKGKRIFERGDLEEPRMIRYLKMIGLKVFRVDEENNEIEIFGKKDEQEEIIGFAGHAKGHTDGRVSGLVEAPKTDHLLEIKTMAAKYFTQWIAKGIKISHPKYYSQAQRYMGGQNLKRALICATNKDNEDIDAERVEFDKDHYEILLEKERDIITTFEPIWQKLSPSNYECKYCSHFDVCQKNSEPEKNCRTCYYAEPSLNGEWICGKDNNSTITVEKQRIGCGLYKRLF